MLSEQVAGSPRNAQYGAFTIPEHWNTAWKSTCEQLEEKAIEVREILQRQAVSGNAKNRLLRSGKTIKKRATEVGAALIVMGAYGKSRLRQKILGGTTATLIKQTGLPLFLAH